MRPAGPQIGEQGYQRGRREFHKARITDQGRKLGAQMPLHLVGVIGLERAIVGTMEPDQNRHDFAQTQLRGPLALDRPAGQLQLQPFRHELATEIIDMTKQFE